MEEINETKSAEFLDKHSESIIRSYINKDDTIGFDVFVCGGENYGDNDIEYKEPHFYIQKDNNVIRIKIPQLQKWNKNKNLEFFLKDKRISNLGFDQDIKNLKKWLDDKNDIINTHTNIQVIIFEWNTNNIYNKFVKKI